MINTISDNCLFEAYLCKQNIVDSRTTHRVAGDLGLLQQPISELPKDNVNNELAEIENMLDRLEQKN